MATENVSQAKHEEREFQARRTKSVNKAVRQQQELEEYEYE